MHLVSPSSVFTAHLKWPGPGDLFKDALEDHRTKRLQYTNILKDKKKIQLGSKCMQTYLAPSKTGVTIIDLDDKDMREKGLSI